MAFHEGTLCGFFHTRAQEMDAVQPFLMGRFDANGDPTDDFRTLTWGETRRQVLELASGLLALGIRRGDKAAIFSESRPRWVIADQAIQAVGGVEVPLYPTLSKDELAYMISDSESRAVFCSTRDKAEMVRAIRPGTGLEFIITMESGGSDPGQGVYHFNEVMEMGRQNLDMAALEKSIALVRPQDVVSIIYTSGTTGRPKGAMLTHANFMAAMDQFTDPTLIRRQAQDRDLHLLFLVHLPICHVYGRSCDYHVGGLKQGGILAFEPDFSRIPKTLLELRPNVIISIPRFFEKVYDQVTSIVSRQPGYVRKMFAWAMRQGEKFTGAMAKGERLGMLDLFLFSQANVLVFNRLRKEAGMDRLVMAGSGGGKLDKEVCTFIRSMGIQLTEGYGLTETAAILNYNAPEFTGIDRDNLNWFQNKMIDWTYDCMVRKQAQGKSPHTNPLRSLKLAVAYNTLAYRLQIKPGTVGKAVLGTQEKIADDGEILVKGPQIFTGYWKMPRETRECFTEDGWFMTGDIGRFDSEGFLEITDRKKELFVTSGGKNVAPHPIELMITGRPYIDQACLTGDGEKYLTCLIVPDFPELKRFARKKGITFTDHADLIRQGEIRELIQAQINEVNQRLARYEQIKYFTLLPRPFSVEGGELTPTLKLKRRVIKELYREEIKAMYGASSQRADAGQTGRAPETFIVPCSPSER
ncbi:MAG: long-chain fatty acid--CoA ligase [Pseudomonadota bacterium]|jgi:long-chain acyl-CoA synthetase|uniref:Long-chain-fatty-acid--CoA ligase FadD15 n=1 Tax=anaerobic digester metagenome TaxID=1263854 RepID=A0A485LWF3_9ZZZZ|nr:long-chain fatty acid--CoA ligase [Pseudomonadota bacterium]